MTHSQIIETISNSFGNYKTTAKEGTGEAFPRELLFANRFERQ